VPQSIQNFGPVEAPRSREVSALGVKVIEVVPEAPRSREVPVLGVKVVEVPEGPRSREVPVLGVKVVEKAPEGPRSREIPVLGVKVVVEAPEGPRSREIPVVVVVEDGTGFCEEARLRGLQNRVAALRASFARISSSVRPESPTGGFIATPPNMGHFAQRIPCGRLRNAPVIIS